MLKAALTSFTVALCGLALSASAAWGAPAEYAGSSSDGSKVFFTTAAKLVPGDTDNGFVDVYERFYDEAPGIETYVTREISTGPTGGNDSHDVTFDAVSSDGTKVFFSTAESLVPEDRDKVSDVYERNTVTGETILVSGGSPSCAPCGNREIPATFVGATPSGSRVFISTDEQLTEEDADEASDVYVRDPSAAEPVLATPGGSAPVTFRGASSDGTKVVFETADKLAAGDSDSEADIYERDLNAETTELVSPAGTCPAPLIAQECAPIYRAMTADGSRVFFETRAQLVGADHDSFQDVYEWSSSSGTPTLISTSEQGEKGGGGFNAIYAGSAAEGEKVFFETSESLSAKDTDEAGDVYERASGSTNLVTPGTADLNASFDKASPDGATVLFSTREALGGGDSGEKLDVYKQSGATTTLVTPGSPEFDATFLGASSDTSDVYYGTAQKVSPSDLDTNSDIYEKPGVGSPVLVSAGPEGGNGSQTAHLSAVSDDGALAFFTTKERLTVDDNFAGETDVYSHSETGTRLVSVGNSGELQLGPQAPGLTAVSPTSPNASTEPRVIGEAEPGTAIKVYPTADCSGVPAGTGTAAELKGAGIEVVVKTGSTTTFHATATNASGDTSGCSNTSVTYTQQSTPPPPEEEPSGGGGGGGGGGSGGGGSGSGGGGSSGGSGEGVKVGNVVYVTPLVRITFGPAATTRSRRPVFRFIDATEQPNTQFFCRIDHKAWKGCSSPYRPKSLKLGKHVFAVKGKSVAGQWSRPISRRFKVVGK
ncbi:MAG: TolB family protein [Solirubrobacterales bacterium]